MTRLLRVLLILGLVLQSISTAGQSGYKSVSLRKVGRFGGCSTDNTIRIKNVVLERVRTFEGDWVHLFQLYDPRAKFRRGVFEGPSPGSIPEFAIVTNEAIGKVLVEQKAEWFDRRVNVYLSITDLGLTPLTCVGYVVRVERLNEKGKVDKVVP